MKIDIEKELICEAGEVVIHSTEGLDKKYPLVGEVRLDKHSWLTTKWTREGKCIAHATQFDISNPKEQKSFYAGMCKEAKTGKKIAISGFSSLRAMDNHVRGFSGWELIGSTKVIVTEGEFEDAGSSNVRG